MTRAMPHLCISALLLLPAGCTVKKASVSDSGRGAGQGKGVPGPQPLVAARPRNEPDLGPRPTVTLRVVNRTKTHRYTYPGRSMFEALVLERQEGGKWVGVPYRPAVCSEGCPTDGSRPSSCTCRPGIPWAGQLPPGKQIEHDWNATLYVQRTVDKCFCHDERAAPPGRYRATACVYPKVQCVPPSECKATAKEPGWVRGGLGVRGDKLCASAELELRDKDQIVQIVIKERDR